MIMDPKVDQTENPPRSHAIANAVPSGVHFIQDTGPGHPGYDQRQYRLDDFFSNKNVSKP